MQAQGSWIEIDAAALAHNVAVFRRLAGADRRLMAVVKANAYGHGMLEVARIALANGADWLGVFNIHEALALREAGLAAPILVLGPCPAALAPQAAAAADIRLTCASPAALNALLDLELSHPLKLHLKLETGTHRQGFMADELSPLAALAEHPTLAVEGLYTHYADIEDTTDHRFADEQRQRFDAMSERLAELGIRPALPHTACSAAALLFPTTYYAMLRVGIALYGLWPSKETFVSAHQLDRPKVSLKPVMSWKTRIAQIKSIAAGDYVSYGRTWRAARPTRLAVLPVGYANGYDRGLSSTAFVLIDGRRAQIVGRVCMNMCLADVTDIPDAAAGSEVVLLGRQNGDAVTADDMAAWLGTINYEVVTRAEPAGPRIVVGEEA